MNNSQYSKILITITGLFITLIAAPSQAVSATNEWTRCGTSDCLIDTTVPVRLRYGKAERWIYAIAGVAKAGESIPCNGGLGDLSPNEVKFCEYQELTGDDLYLATNTTRCGGDGGSCYVGTTKDQPYWIKYGTDDKWIMLPVAAKPDGYVDCSLDTFGYDPQENAVKHCSAAGPYADIRSWTQCATDGLPCKTTQLNRVQLVRYGYGDAGSDHVYREVLAVSVACWTDTFGADPMENATKRCYVANDAKPAIAISSVTGRWHQVATHNGPTSFTRLTGVTGSRSTTNTSEWQVAVTATFKTEADAGVVKQENSLAVTASKGESTAFTQALEQTTSTSNEVKCSDLTNAVNVGLYQWKYDVLEECTKAGDCAAKSEILTNHTRCIYDPKISLIEFLPVCRPGCCADQNCTTCLDQPAACAVMVNPQFAE